MKNYSILLLYISLFLLVLSFNCSNTSSSKGVSQSDSLLMYFKNIHNYTIKKTDTLILVLTDKGCPSCNKHFANTIRALINKENCIILIKANSSVIDISNFLGNTPKNVYIEDYNKQDFEFLNYTAIIKVKDMKIDTIIKIKLKDMDVQFQNIPSDFLEYPPQKPTETG